MANFEDDPKYKDLMDARNKANNKAARNARKGLITRIAALFGAGMLAIWGRKIVDTIHDNDTVTADNRPAAEKVLDESELEDTTYNKSVEDIMKRREELREKYNNGPEVNDNKRNPNLEKNGYEKMDEGSYYGSKANDNNGPEVNDNKRNPNLEKNGYAKMDEGSYYDFEVNDNNGPEVNDNKRNPNLEKNGYEKIDEGTKDIQENNNEPVQNEKEPTSESLPETAPAPPETAPSEAAPSETAPAPSETVQQPQAEREIRSVETVWNPNFVMTQSGFPYHDPVDANKSYVKFVVTYSDGTQDIDNPIFNFHYVKPVDVTAINENHEATFTYEYTYKGVRYEKQGIAICSPDIESKREEKSNEYPDIKGEGNGQYEEDIKGMNGNGEVENVEVDDGKGETSKEVNDGVTEGLPPEEPDTSEIAPDTSETAPDTSETAPDTSGTAPDTSETAPDTSGTAPDTSGTAPDTSETFKQVNDDVIEELPPEGTLSEEPSEEIKNVEINDNLFGDETTLEEAPAETVEETPIVVDDGLDELKDLIASYEEMVKKEGETAPETETTPEISEDDQQR